MMALYFLVLIMIPTISFFRNKYKTPYMDELEKSGSSNGNQASSYWERTEMSLKDIALAVGTAFVIVAASFKIADVFAVIIPSGENVNFFLNLASGILGDGYLVLTTMTMLLVTIFPRFFENITGAQEIGTYLIYIFFVVIGVPASLPLILQHAPMILVLVAIMVLVNMLVSFTFGKLFKFSLEEIILTSNANIGGPTTAAAMAISRGWTKLVGPILLVGTLGYVIGNYAGVFVGSWFGGF